MHQEMLSLLMDKTVSTSTTTCWRFHPGHVTRTRSPSWRLQVRFTRCSVLGWAVIYGFGKRWQVVKPCVALVTSLQWRLIGAFCTITRRYRERVWCEANANGLICKRYGSSAWLRLYAQNKQFALIWVLSLSLFVLFGWRLDRLFWWLRRLNLFS